MSMSFYRSMAPYLYQLDMIDAPTCQLLTETMTNMDVVLAEENRRSAAMKSAREEAARKRRTVPDAV